MTDIVERLRTTQLTAGLRLEAADEIERLRAALEIARPYVRPSHGGDIQADADLREIERLRAALNALVADFGDYHYHGCKEDSENCCFAQIILRNAKKALGET